MRKVTKTKRPDISASIGDKIAIGHVGGFVEQKNHRFILEICECIKKIPSKKRLNTAKAILKVLEEHQEKVDIIEENKGKRPKLLLHCCCAPCSSYCLEYLIEYFDIFGL